ncbi:hypothetical protein GCM10007276_32040 [Agaricicola taiwanensis]|uniref:HTH hxlR-type domain-containing protein n=2 Tax=Agaricicola taiwanensis TaxID=591372 RepID=A0A8J2YL70_9RHOB|nr:hypothetical protein GCM10007276_32040 [Agaricicola taiwanensis]
MEVRGGYGQFCPVSMAAEILCTRWTALIVRELLCGTTRFNDLRRGVPRMSPALLSKRLRELEKSGVIITVPRGAGTVEYHLSPPARNSDPSSSAWASGASAGWNRASRSRTSIPRC